MRYRLIDFVVANAGVPEGLLAGDGTHLGVVPVALARLLELDHPHTDHEHSATHCSMLCFAWMPFLPLLLIDYLSIRP